MLCSYEWSVNDKFSLELGAHRSYTDSNDMETYFGVDSKNRGSSNLPDYNASSGIKDA